MTWQVEIGTILESPTGNVWGPFCRVTVPLEMVEDTVRSQLAKLTDLLVKTHQAGWQLEKLLYVSVRQLSPPPTRSSSSNAVSNRTGHLTIPSGKRPPLR